jgi:hypothetical protein
VKREKYNSHFWHLLRAHSSDPSLTLLPFCVCVYTQTHSLFHHLSYFIRGLLHFQPLKSCTLLWVTFCVENRPKSRCLFSIFLSYFSNDRLVPMRKTWRIADLLLLFSLF